MIDRIITKRINTFGVGGWGVRVAWRSDDWHYALRLFGVQHPELGTRIELFRMTGVSLRIGSVFAHGNQSIGSARHLDYTRRHPLNPHLPYPERFCFDPPLDLTELFALARVNRRHLDGGHLMIDWCLENLPDPFHAELWA